MKKIIVLLSVFLFSLLSVNSTYTANTTITSINSNNAKFKLYKQAILTRHQILLDYKDGEKINKKIEKYFISLYFKTDRIKRLKEIEKKMGDLIVKYDNNKLTLKQKKSLNIIKNLYYRALIDLKK